MPWSSASGRSGFGCGCASPGRRACRRHMRRLPSSALRLDDRDREPVADALDAAARTGAGPRRGLDVVVRAPLPYVRHAQRFPPSSAALRDSPGVAPPRLAPFEDADRLRAPEAEIDVTVRRLECDDRGPFRGNPHAMDVARVLRELEPGGHRSLRAPRGGQRRGGPTQEAVWLYIGNVLVRLLRIDRRWGDRERRRDVEAAEAGERVEARGRDVLGRGA